MNTPRTDAALIDNGELVGQFPEWVRADFARQLETEVQELRRVVAKCNAEFKAMAFLGMGDSKEAIEDTAAVLARTGGK